MLTIFMIIYLICSGVHLFDSIHSYHTTHVIKILTRVHLILNAFLTLLSYDKSVKGYMDPVEPGPQYHMGQKKIGPYESLLGGIHQIFG